MRRRWYLCATRLEAAGFSRALATNVLICRSFAENVVPSDAIEMVLDPFLGASEGVKRREIAGSRRSRQA